MKKMRLDLDTLAIESFDTTGIDESTRGTVKGHLPPDTYWRYCSDGLTCADSCDVSCAGSCYDPSCGQTYCGTCHDWTCGETYCGTCDPYCCCTCSCN